MRLLVRLLRLEMHLLPCLGHQSLEAVLEVSTVQFLLAAETLTAAPIPGPPMPAPGPPIPGPPKP